VAVDRAGNVYVAETGSDEIRKITPAGVVSPLAGSAGQPGSANGTGSQAQFDRPTGLAVDSAGNVYVADQNNDEIREITPAGLFTLAGSAGQPGSADGAGSKSQFNNPAGVAVDSARDIYVGDGGNDEVRKITTYALSMPPTIAAISPASGPAAGGTAVAIIGTNLTGATKVYFGGTLASFSVASDTQVMAVAPAGAGTVDVTVVTPLGTSGTWLPDRFTYAVGAGTKLTAAALAQIPAAPAGTSGVNTVLVWSDGGNWTLPAAASLLDAPDNRHAAAADLYLGGEAG
jgi:hypothetical protein